MRKIIVSIVFSMAAAISFAARVWYVDDDNYKEELATLADYVAAGFDGKEKAKAFGTIQIAIDASTSEDTIYVCPGIYDKGVKNPVIQNNEQGLSRIYITKTLRIESLEGAAKTHIVGYKDCSDEGGRGLGPNSVRCIMNWGSSPVFKGFTIRDGGTVDTGGDNPKARGSALYSYSGSPCLVDCVVEECATTHGTFRKGIVVRTLIRDNFCTIYGVAGAESTLYSCIIMNNNCGGPVLGGGINSLVHCTVFANTTYNSIFSGGEKGAVLNNIVALSYSNTKDGADVPSAAENVKGNVTKDEHGIYHIIAPAAGDFRVLKGSVAETICAGAPADGSGLDRPVPEEFRGKDFYGNPITENCVAGAVQKVVEPTGGAMLFNNISRDYAIEVDGWKCIKPDVYAFPTDERKLFKVSTRFKSGKIYAWTNSVDHGSCRFPDAFTDTYYFMPPPQKDVVMTNTYRLARGEIWVDAQAGSDTDGDGTFEKPYKTLQKGSDVAEACTFVWCKQGSYDSGGRVCWANDVFSRLVIQKSLRFVAVDGPEKTFIVGEADEDSPVDTQPGCGPNAARGIAAYNNHIAIEGFTFRNCHTFASGEKTLNGHQGCAMRAAGSIYTSIPTLMDCVIEGTCGAAAHTVTGGRVVRCLFKNVKSGCPVYSTTLLSACVIENCAYNKNDPVGVAFNCTSRNSGIFNKNFACVASGGARAKKVNYAGSLIFGFDSYDSGVTGFVREDPQFASVTGAKILRSSPAFTCGEVPTADNYGTNYYIYASTDYFGRPISFVDGKPVAGADMLGVFSIFDKRGFEVTDASAEVTQLAAGKVELPAGCSLVADIPATETEVKEYFITVTVAEGAELKVTLDETVATYGGGTHLLRVKTAEAARAMQLAAVDGLVEIASLKNNAGAVLLLR